MNIEMLDTAEKLPSKRTRTVKRGTYIEILNNLMSSDKQAVAIHCDTIDDAIKKNVGLYNAATNHKVPVKVWRKESDVYIQKKETTDGSKDM